MYAYGVVLNRVLWVVKKRNIKERKTFTLIHCQFKNVVHYTIIKFEQKKIGEKIRRFWLIICNC